MSNVERRIKKRSWMLKHTKKSLKHRKKRNGIRFAKRSDWLSTFKPIPLERTVKGRKAKRRLK